MAADIGRIEESYDYYVKTARTDLDDFHGNVKDGVHAANYGRLLDRDYLRLCPDAP